MILTGQKIKENVLNHKIVIEPFDESSLNPNSINFRLGDYVKVYKNNVLDPKVKQEVEILSIPDDGLVLHPDRLYLGYTLEKMGSNHFVPIISGRSSTGRLGLFVHITADLIDIGSINHWTLQLHATQPIRIYKGMLIGQVTFWKPQGEIVLYDGKYQGSTEPAESQIWRDFSL
ncbi:dCTP deaminase [Paenibacillus enshidis]|uniref:dCTP deaminase n=2 Tax=Paenibacillus TaxID=44249 RepID=A0ABV5APX6_9BACL